LPEETCYIRYQFSIRKEDILILFGGTNDICKLNTDSSLQYISQFMENNTQTNILATVLHYFDLAPTSNVNQEVLKFKKKLCKYLKQFAHCTTFKTENNKEYFTKHGLHLNGFGKEVICKQLAAIIEGMFQYTKDILIFINWDTEQIKNNDMEKNNYWY
jgi:lysophospholipase L1-like esterase